MNINRALIGRALNIPSGNGDNNDVMMYHRLISLIDQYNILARDKGLPIKGIPVYVNNVNNTLTMRLIVSILKDIDRVKNIKEEEYKTLTDVEFTNNTLNDGIWTYTKDNNGKVRVTINANAFSESFDGDSATLGYEHMPYEKLIDTDGNEYRITSYNYMFTTDAPSRITSLTIDNWTNRNVTSMEGMFSSCIVLTSLTLGENFNTSNVKDMEGMFYNSYSLTSLTLGTNFNTSNVENMEAMFRNCMALTALALGRYFVVPSNYSSSSIIELAPSAACTITMNETMYNAFKQYDLASYTFSPNTWNASGETVQEITVTPPPA